MTHWKNRLVRIGALLILTLLATACTFFPDAEPRTAVVEILIDQVEVHVLESLPPQVSLAVTGTIGDGCSSLDKVTQSRQGNEIKVRITAIRLLDRACIQIAQPYTAVIPLEGDFQPGTYTLTVNSIQKPFTIQ